MNNYPNIDLSSLKKLARLAGLLYLVVIVAGIVALVIRANIIVAGDPTATADAIRASEGLFRLAFVIDLVSYAAWLLVAVLLFVVLNPFGKILAGTFVAIVAVGVGMLSLNMLNYFSALLTLDHGGYLDAFSPAEIQAQAYHHLQLHENGLVTAQIYFASWLLPLGYLVAKSGWFPRALGILLVAGGFAYLADFVIVALFPAATAWSYPTYIVVFVAEIAFCLWLMAVGVKDETDGKIPVHSSFND